MADPNVQRQLNRIEQKVDFGNGSLNAAKNKIDEVKESLGKLSTRLKLPEILNALTLIVTLHNAALLSRSLVETLGDIISNGLAIIGFKDEEGKAYDFNEILGKQVDQMAKDLLGETVWNNTKVTWIKANRVISTASNIVWSIRSIQNSTQEVVEWTAENTGKIGNALKRWGVVGEKAYPDLPETVRSQDAWRRKFHRVFDGLDNLDDAANSLQGVTSEVRETVDEFNELKEEKEEFQKAVKEAAIQVRPPNDPVVQRTTDEKDDSASPIINPTDLLKR